MLTGSMAKYAERAERNRILDSLFRMGISLPDIAVVTGYSHSIIRKTFVALGGRKCFTGREPGHELFARQFFVWAHLAYSTVAHRLPEDVMTFKALEWVLKVPQIAREAELIVSAIKLLSFPSDYPYERKLLEDILQPRDPRCKEVRHLSGRRLLLEYIHYLDALRERLPERENLLMSMQVWAFRKYGTEFRPPLFEGCLMLMRQVLKILSPRKREVIYNRYGFINGKILSINECAVALKIRPSDVRRYERKALADLRKPENKEQLECLLEEPSFLLARTVNQFLDESRLSAKSAAA